jgi:hypothetical protein
MSSKQRKIGYTVLLALFAGYLGGCGAQPQLAAIEVLNYANCQGAERGVRQVSYAEVAKLRGSTLLGITTEASGEPPGVILLAVFKGAQPTPGFSFSLSAASVVQGTAELTVQWHEPEPNTAQAQMMTYPCLVIGIEPGGYSTVRVRESDGTLLGELAI